MGPTSLPGRRIRDAGLSGAAALLGVALVALLVIPLVALVIRVAPAALVMRLTSRPVLEALRLSVETSLVATALTVAGGLPVAYALAMRRFPGRRALQVLVELPLVLPPTVAGLGLLLAFGRAGLLGRALSAFGVALPFTTAAVVLAQAFVAAPFFIGAARAAFESVEPRYLAAAATLRASDGWAFVRVVLPLSLPSVIAGTGLAWARALGEFGATITFAGNLPGRTQTMPLAVYVALQSDLDASVALGVVLLGVSLVLVLALRAIAPRASTSGLDAHRHAPQATRAARD